jgi:plastocyanin
VFPAVAATVIAATGGAAFWSTEGAPPAPRPPAAADLEVTLHDARFGRDVYEIDAGRRARVRIVNRDRIIHTFTIPALGVDRGVSPGGSIVVELDAAQGEYAIYCRPHSDMSEPDPALAGMAARLVVK